MRYCSFIENVLKYLHLPSKFVFFFWKQQLLTFLMYLLWACLAKRLHAPAFAGGLNLPDKQIDWGCWLRSGFKSRRGQLVHFQDPFSYWRFTGATLYVPCLDWGWINYIHFPYFWFSTPYTLFQLGKCCQTQSLIWGQSEVKFWELKY